MNAKIKKFWHVVLISWIVPILTKLRENYWRNCGWSCTSFLVHWINIARKVWIFVKNILFFAETRFYASSLVRMLYFYCRTIEVYFAKKICWFRYLESKCLRKFYVITFKIDIRIFNHHLKVLLLSMFNLGYLICNSYCLQNKTDFI